MVNNITFTKTLDGGTTQVTLDTTNMQKSFVKNLFNLTPAKSTQNQDTDTTSNDFGPKDTLIVDLLRVEVRYTIDGSISQGAYSGDTHTNVEDRKDDIENMFLAGGVVTFNYDNESGVTGNIEKMTITKVLNDGQDNDVTGLTYNTGEVGYIVKMTIVKGVSYGE